MTSKVLANRSELPVIIITSSNIDILSYFNNVNQSLCFLFDEFEKIIDHNDKERIAPLLSFVDGTITSAKHLMIFTSNETNISPFFIDRPGRIRYIKNYGSLSEDVVKEIVSDKLIYKEHAKDLIDWVIYFNFLTIDILISIINEINIHNLPPSEFKSFFNADNEKSSYDIRVFFKNPVTGETFEAETYQTTKKDPAEYIQDLLEYDESLYINGKRYPGNIKTNIIGEAYDGYPQSIHIRDVSGPVQDAEGNNLPHTIMGRVNNSDLSGTALAQGLITHEERAYCRTFVKTGLSDVYIDTTVEYEIELKFERRSLYSNNFHAY